MATTRVIHNREHWLTIAADLINERITAPAGLGASSTGDPLIGAIRLSVGPPSLARGRGRGKTFEPSMSADGTTEIFISSFLQEPVEVLTNLTHEMVHASVGLKHGHNEIFGAAAAKVGFINDVKVPEASSHLSGELALIAQELGPYPHAKLSEAVPVNVQTTRLLKCICINDSCPFKSVHGKPYNLRITWSVASEGTPKCGVCDHRMGVIKPSGQKGGGGGGGGAGGEDEEPQEEPEVIVIDPQPPPSGGGGGEGDSGDETDDPDDGESQPDAGGDSSGDGDEGSSAEAESGSASEGEESESGSTTGDTEGEGQEDGNEAGEGTDGEGDEDGSASGEAEGDGSGEDGGDDESSLSGPDEVVQAQGERHVIQTSANPEPSMGGDAVKGKGKVGRAKVHTQHEVTMDCTCSSCVAQRKLMGL